MSTCRSCGAQIDWVKLTSGKNHPVEGEYIKHDEAENGDRLVTDGGNVYAVDRSKSFPNVKGRISHFSVCPDADKWRRSK